MTIEGGTAIVLAYVLVSMGGIIAFMLAAFVIGWFIGRLRQRAAANGRRSDAGQRRAYFAVTLWRGIFTPTLTVVQTEIYPL